MQHYLFIFIQLLFLSGSDVCNRKEQTRNILAIEVSFNDTYSGNDFYRAYYSGDLVMYMSHYYFDSSTVQMLYDSAIDQISEQRTLIAQEKRKSFFVFHKDSIYGYKFSPIADYGDNKPLKVDSVVKIIVIGGNMEKFLTLNADGIVWSRDKNEMKKIYSTPESDTLPGYKVILHYSKKLNHLQQSFSKPLDSAYQMKLFKTETFFDEYYSVRDQQTWPARAVIIGMKEVSVDNPKEVKYYFDRYRSKVKK